MWEFEEELQRPRDPQAGGIERIGRLRLLYQGHFLQRETERPWILRARQELRDRICGQSAMRRVSANMRAVGRMPRTSIDPGSSSTPWMRVCMGLDAMPPELRDHSEALQAYRRCRELLTRFLGIPPNAKTQALYLSVRERAAYPPSEARCEHMHLGPGRSVSQR